MTPKAFNAILNRRIELTKQVLESKADEYASENRLYNFERAAQMGATTPRQALYGMLLKHLVSVHDLVTGKLENTEQMADEKIGDTINYLILLEAMLEDERCTLTK